jgi:5,10-methylenetetrahydrofolate reductase
VPPLLEQGEAGVQALLQKVQAVHEAVGLDGINIPEIREESSKSDKGERLKPFAPRVEPRRLALRIRDELGLECMINRVVVHLEASQQADWFRETWEEYGVRQFVLVGGEKSGVAYPGPSVPEANRLVREVIDDPRLRVGNICIPTRAGEAARMARKIATGTDFFTTQIVYHPEEFTGLLDALAAIEPTLPPTAIYLTVCPVRGARNIRFLHWLGVSLSAELEDWLTRDADQVMERSVEQIARCWRDILHHRRDTGCVFPVGVSLAPIGKIPDPVTVELARLLAER